MRLWSVDLIVHRIIVMTTTIFLDRDFCVYGRARERKAWRFYTQNLRPTFRQARL